MVKREKKAVAVNAYLRRRIQRRVGAVVLTVVIVVLASWADRHGLLLYAGDEMGRYHGQAVRVSRVVDGDTIVVAVPDGDANETRVRFWGIDAPETAKPEQGLDAEPFADEATALVRKYCDGQQVVLELEAHRVRGNYGRIIAHVMLADGSSLNERLLAAGLARWDKRFPHSRMDRYEIIAKQGRLERQGMWAQQKSGE